MDTRCCERQREPERLGGALLGSCEQREERLETGCCAGGGLHCYLIGKFLRMVVESDGVWSLVLPLMRLSTCCSMGCSVGRCWRVPRETAVRLLLTGTNGSCGDGLGGLEVVVARTLRRSGKWCDDLVLCVILCADVVARCSSAVVVGRAT